MVEGPTTLIFQQTTKVDQKRKDDKIDELCKQVENLYLMMKKQPKQGLSQDLRGPWLQPDTGCGVYQQVDRSGAF